MSEPSVRFERDGDVALVTLNRPDAMNTLNFDLAQALHGAAERCRKEAVRAVVLTGSGRAFSAGGDLGAFAETDDARKTRAESGRHAHDTRPRRAQDTQEVARRFPSRDGGRLSTQNPQAYVQRPMSIC